MQVDDVGQECDKKKNSCTYVYERKLNCAKRPRQDNEKKKKKKSNLRFVECNEQFGTL